MYAPDHFTPAKHENDVLLFERDNEDPQLDDLKNQYSTFIEQLEETTQKLMHQVFNTEYKPEETQDLQDEDERGYYQPRKGSRESNKVNLLSKLSAEARGRQKGVGRIEGPQSFRNFLTRNQRWCQLKGQHIQRQQQKKEQNERKHYTEIPQILRGSREKLDPIYERAQELHLSKQKRRAYKQLEEARQEQEQIAQYSFHPQIVSKAKTRTLQQYLRDKAEWEQKKQFNRELRRLQQEAGKYQECSFAPQLVSKQMPAAHNSRPQEKVQERLLRSLQKIFIQI